MSSRRAEVTYAAVPLAGQNVWWQSGRGLLHEEVAEVCGWVTGNPCPTSISGLVAAARQSAQVVQFGWLFVQLRTAREVADYSHEVVIDRDAALTMIGHARAAVDALDAVTHDDPAWQAFAALMLIESKPRTYQLPTKGEPGP